MEYFKKIIAAGLLMAASQSALAALAVPDQFVIAQDTASFIYPFRNDIIDGNLAPPVPSDFTLISGQLAPNGIQYSSDGLTVEPAAGYTGLLEIEYVITDGSGSDTTLMSIDVQGAPDQHEAIDDSFYVLEGDVDVPLGLRYNDNFGGASVTAVSGTTEGGTLTLDGGFGSDVLYTPPANFTGTDTFTYTLEDADGLFPPSQATVTVYVGIDPNDLQTGPTAGLIPGLSREEQVVYNSIVEACEIDSEALPCADIAELDNDQLKELVQEVSGRHVKLQSRTLRHIRYQQSQNLRSRLQQIRQGNSQLSVSGLNAAVLGQSVPLSAVLQDGLNSLRGGSAGDTDIATPWGAFINGNLTLGEGDSENGRPDYEQDGYNITMGLDYRFSDTLVGGAAAGFSDAQMDFSLDRGTQDSSSYSLALFGNYYPSESVYVDGLLMYIDGALDVDRLISVGAISQQLASDTNSQQTVLSASTGYEFSSASWQGSVYGRVEYSDLTVDAYRESGGSFALAVEEQESSSFDAALGGRLGYVFAFSRGVVVPNIEVEYLKRNEDDFRIESRFINAPVAPVFSLMGEEEDTDHLNISTSISAVFSGGRSGFFRYETMLLQDDYDFSSYSLGFRMEF